MVDYHVAKVLPFSDTTKLLRRKIEKNVQVKPPSFHNDRGRDKLINSKNNMIKMYVLLQSVGASTPAWKYL